MSHTVSQCVKRCELIRTDKQKNQNDEEAVEVEMRLLIQADNELRLEESVPSAERNAKISG